CEFRSVRRNADSTAVKTLWIDACSRIQFANQLRIKGSTAVTQSPNRLRIIPWSQRRENAATGPGRFPARGAALQQSDPHARFAQPARRHQTDDASADDNGIGLP